MINIFLKYLYELQSIILINILIYLIYLRSLKLNRIEYVYNKIDSMFTKTLISVINSDNY